MSVVKMAEATSPFPHANNNRPMLDPSRIRCARETAGFSKVELAKLLSVTPRTISNYEEEGAPLGKARSLADVLAVNPSFFTGLPEDPSIEDLVADRVWFRSLRKSSARQRKSAVGHGRNALLFFHWITNHFMLPDNDLEAHDFAANLLMPERRVEALLPHHASLQQILEAKRYFRVSAFAMAYRAHTLGRLTDWEYRSVCSELSARGYRTGEPKGIPMETSQVFTFIAQSNHAKGISTSTIAEETGLSTKELHGLSFGNLIAVTGGSESAEDVANRQLVHS